MKHSHSDARNDTRGPARPTQNRRLVLSARLLLGVLPAWISALIGALPVSAQTPQSKTQTPAPQAPSAIKPMSLDESIAIALGHSPQARVARFARDIAQTQADRRRPVIRPTLEARATEAVQGPGATTTLPNNQDIIFLQEHSARVDVVFVQPIFQPGLADARQVYSANLSGVEMSYRKELVDLAQSVNHAYLSVLRADSGLGVAQNGLTLARREQTLVQQEVVAGVAKPVDEQTVAAQVAEADAGVLQAESGLAQARENFNRILGRPLEAAFTLEPVAAPTVIPDSPDTAVLIALQNRPELIGLEQNLRAAHASVTLARTQVQPAFRVRGEYSEQTPSALIHEHYAAAMLELNWQILDAGKSNLDIQEAIDQTKRLEALTEQTRQDITAEVRNYWRSMRLARDQMVEAQAQRQSLEAALAVAERNYEAGRGTIYEVEGALRDLRGAKERVIQDTYDLYAAQLNFNYAQGVGAASLEIYFPPRQTKRSRKSASAATASTVIDPAQGSNPQ